jgi:LmbE family N-acetylglucosaminyl deacetylase
MDPLSFDVKAMLAPPNIMDARRVLCIQPHPDDNEVGMGGTIAALSDAGCEVHYLTVTDGDLGNRDRAATREETAAQRRRETEAAGKHLGVKAFHYLNHGDSTLNDVAGLSVEIARVIRLVRPEVIFCPDPYLHYEGHYDHVVTGLAAANAFHLSGVNHFPLEDGFDAWSARAIGFYFTARPNTVIDTGAYFEKKFEAIALHVSQMDDQTLAMYRVYFTMKGAELARGRGFAMGEGLKVLSPLHMHCFVDAENM